MKPVEGLLGMENSGCWNLKENNKSLCMLVSVSMWVLLNAYMCVLDSEWKKKKSKQLSEVGAGKQLLEETGVEQGQCLGGYPL